MINILDALRELRGSAVQVTAEEPTEESIEESREKVYRERLDIWNQIEFTNRITVLFEDYKRDVPDAQLEFVGKNLAAISGTNPMNGTPFTHLYKP